MEPLVSVIIPTYRRERQLARCLDALARQTEKNFEVIVINDDPAHDVGNVARASQDRLALTYITNPRHQPATSRNEGVKLAHAGILAFLDDDTEPSTTWIADGLNAFADGTAVAFVGKTIPPEGQFPHPFRHYLVVARAGRYPTCNLWMRKTAFDAAGGFDARFFFEPLNMFQLEDTELCFKIMARGGAVGFRPDVLVYHPVYSSSALRPIREARKALFHPLLHKLHPREYDAMTSMRIGPLPVPRAALHMRIGGAFVCFAAAIAFFAHAAWVGIPLAGLSALLALADAVRIVGIRNIARINPLEWIVMICSGAAAFVVYAAFLVAGMFRARSILL